MDLVTFVSSVVGAGSLLIGVASFINGKQDARRMTSRVTGLQQEVRTIQKDLSNEQQAKKELVVQLARAEKSEQDANRSRDAAEEAQARAETQAAEIDSLNNELRKKLPIEIMHTVLLQGGCRSGKTTYVERMARPDLSWEEVSHQIGATIAPRTREALPLCWDNDDGSARQAIGSRRRRIHVLRYIDISGERDEAFLDALIRFDNELVEQKTKKNGQAQDVFGVRLSERLVVMIVWDLSVSFDENATVLNLPRVRALYQNRLGEKYISSIVFMMNKVDIAAVREGQTVRQRAGEDFRRIQEFFRAYLGEEYSPIRIIQGSLKTGEGMPDLHAALLTSLGLSSHYVHSYAGGSKNGPPGTVGVTLD